MFKSMTGYGKAELNVELREYQVEMKSLECQKIAEDLNSRLDIIQEKVNKIDKFSTGLIEEYVVKLEERIKQILK